MEDLEIDLIDNTDKELKEVPQGVKTLAILSIVANSLWMLIFLISGIYFMLFAGAVGGMFAGAFAGLMGVVAIVFLLIMALHVVGLIASIKMMNGSKGAFILYAIPTGLWALLCLMSVSNNQQGNQMFMIICGLASIGFIVGFGLQMKNMPTKK